MARKLKTNPDPAPQCDHSHDEAALNDHYRQYRRKRMSKLNPTFDPTRCGRKASYEIDGKFYCSTHAGQEALRILCGQKTQNTST